jgi:hypothetical protein
MKLLFGAILAGALLSQLNSLNAQTILVDWDSAWSYMHPLDGALPAGSGATTPHPVGSAAWYATAAAFGGYTGPSFTTPGAGFEAGSGDGPIGYDIITYTTAPVPPELPAEFTALGTTLTRPASGSRFTAYFRTTFTVPSDGNLYVSPTLRYLLDDGGFVYLDGELVLVVNEAVAAIDDYTTTAAGTANNEDRIRNADLSLPVGTMTGGSAITTPVTGGNARIVKRITALSPGVHTLAISVHNTSVDSSDLALATQLTAVATDCVIFATASNVTRSSNGTPNSTVDDTISFNLNVVPNGTVSSSWTISAPAGSAAAGKIGAYNASVPVTNIPFGEFASGPVVFTVADTSNSACSTTFSVIPQSIIATNNISSTNLPVFTVGKVDVPGWVFDENTRSFSMSNPGGTTPYVLTSESINTAGQLDLQFSGELVIVDSSSGNEDTDSFVASLIFDGITANPINLITPHDTLIADGVLTAFELATGAGTFTKDLSYVIPANVNSVQLVIQGLNNSANESFTVQGLSVGQAPAELRASAGKALVDNKGTANPSDDTFTVPVMITEVNLNPSTGWVSNSTPASGAYSSTQPVTTATFGPFPVASSPIVVSITDNVNSARRTDVTLSVPAPALTVSAPINPTRVENGPGTADDSFTFDLTITGTDGGPSWTHSTAGVTPAAGAFGTVTFTIPAPLPVGAVVLDVVDASYPAASLAVTVNVNDRYIIGQSDLSGGVVDVTTGLVNSPTVVWANDSLARTLTMGAGGTVNRVVESEVIDLTTSGDVFFSATFRANEVSTGSNFETGDKFKAELVYNVAGTPTTISLVTQYDFGNGAPSTTGTTGGANGAADGFINGYQGAIGTDLGDATVYATTAEDYNAHRNRDEFNRNSEETSVMIDNLFPLSATIPANADDVKLVITGLGAGGSETFTVSNILFSTSNADVDSDMDGMTDAYEDANDLDKNDDSDRDLDLDGDGQSNLHEFLAGTAANDSSSTLKITSVSRNATTGTINWSSVPGKTYRVDFSYDLLEWDDAEINFPSGGDTTTTGPVNLGAFGNPTELYFRVRVQN